MSIKSGLVSYLSGVAGLTALVGTRIGFARMSHGDALPYVVIMQVSGDHKSHLTAATGKVVGRFQFDVFGSTLEEATSVAEQLRQALDGYQGTMGSTRVEHCSLDDERDTFENPNDGDQDGIKGVQQDYMLVWSVSVPTFS